MKSRLCVVKNGHTEWLDQEKKDKDGAGSANDGRCRDAIVDDLEANYHQIEPVQVQAGACTLV